MKNITKIGIAFAAVVASVSAIKLFKTQKAGEELITEIDTKLHKVQVPILFVQDGYIEFRAYITLKNPSNFTLNIKQPLVRFSQGDTLISSSNLSNSQFELKEGETKQLDVISIQMSWTDFLSVVTNANITITGSTTVEKISYIALNINEIISKLNLNYQYLTTVNGFAYKSEKVNI